MFLRTLPSFADSSVRANVFSSSWAGHWAHPYTRTSASAMPPRLKGKEGLNGLRLEGISPVSAESSAPRVPPVQRSFDFCEIAPLLLAHGHGHVGVDASQGRVTVKGMRFLVSTEKSETEVLPQKGSVDFAAAETTATLSPGERGAAAAGGGTRQQERTEEERAVLPAVAPFLQDNRIYLINRGDVPAGC